MEIGTDLFDPVHDLEQDTHAVVGIAAVKIGSVVHPRTDESAEKEEMRGVNLYTVKACLLRSFGSLNKSPYYRPDLINRHIVRLDLCAVTVKCTECELGNDFTIILVNQIRYLFILRNQTVA